MNQWEIWYVKQQNARKELKPAQPNDPSGYDRMYVVVVDPTASSTVICCPVQNSLSGVGLTEVELKKGYATCITKDCKIICHEIYTLPRHFFDRKVGFIRANEQDKIKTSLIFVFDL